MNETYHWFKQKMIEKRVLEGWKLIEDKEYFFEVRLNEKRFERFLFQKEWSQIIQKQSGEETCIFLLMTSNEATKYNVIQQIKKEYVQIFIFDYLMTGQWYTLREVFNKDGIQLNSVGYQEKFQTLEHAFFTELIKQHKYRLPAVTGMLEIENHDIEDLLST